MLGPLQALSAEIKDLISKMLTVNVAPLTFQGPRRITIDEIPKHPWVAPGMAGAVAMATEDTPTDLKGIMRVF